MKGLEELPNVLQKINDAIAETGTWLRLDGNGPEWESFTRFYGDAYSEEDKFRLAGDIIRLASLTLNEEHTC